MLTKLKLTSGAFIAMDRAYIDYKIFQEFTDNGVFYVTKMKKNLRYIPLNGHFLVNKDGLVVLSDHTIELKKDDITHLQQFLILEDFVHQRIYRSTDNDM